MYYNRDFFVSLAFLVFCAAMYAATYSLPEAMFGQMSPALWPRTILIPLAILSILLLVHSQRHPEDNEQINSNLREWFVYYKNPMLCFFLFFIFLVTMPIFGMLIGGLVYVFLTLSILGGWERRSMMVHAAVSAFFVTVMWLIFTQALGVFLPEGVILGSAH